MHRGKDISFFYFFYLFFIFFYFINFNYKIESVLTMSILINLRTIHYHLTIPTNRLLLICERV